MKYIRTKDGIYEFVKITNGYYECNSYIDIEKKISCFAMIKKKDILKQSDTIEELCDEFIGILNGRHIKSLSKDLYILKPCEVIYGAIWTYKGLIYVAKMNEKGELELL